MIGTDIFYAKALLEKGDLVAIPTETVYGLAANALDEQAVLKVFEVKNRPHFDPLIIHFDSFSKIGPYVETIPEVFKNIAHDHCPGPITFLIKKSTLVSDLVTSGSDYVAVRIPAHSMANALLSMVDFPLAAPSANPFGYISPTSAAHVEKQLGQSIPYILDGGMCEVGLESTIIGMSGDQKSLVVYRKGGLEIEALQMYGLPVIVQDTSSSKPDAPGMLLSHYAPRKPLILHNHDGESDFQKPNGRIAYLMLTCSDQVEGHFSLSDDGDLRQAAKNLFALLRQLDDDDNYDVIITEMMPEFGLGLAINDRLKRASLK